MGQKYSKSGRKNRGIEENLAEGFDGALKIFPRCKSKKPLVYAVENGSGYKKGGQVSFFLRKLEANGLCPFAAHALFPYVFGLNRGSWYRWEKSKDLVKVQCPNPIGGVSFEVVRKGKKVSAKVIGKKQNCLANHAIGDKFSLKEAEEGFESLCHSEGFEALSVSVVSHDKSCRYYKKPGKVPHKKLSPEKFCMFANYLSYPLSLSLLYDGKNGKGKSGTVCCGGFNEIQIKAQKSPLSFLLNFLEKALRLAGFPKDVLDKSIEIKAVKMPNCPKKIKAGQAFQFNLHDSSMLCPAVFYNLFPYLVMLNSGVFPYWAKGKKCLDVRCPDTKSEIVHRISARGGKNG